MITGRCECARVQYAVDGEIVDFSHCHCSICRRIHGAAFATWGGVARDKFSYLSGEDSLKIYAFSVNADSIFCKHCGSTLLVDFKPEPEALYITLGTVDGTVKCPPGYHQFVGSKAPWFEIHDELPQYKGWPEDG
ncbi:MAG: GFA family protein [bacterium]|nr:GFA family protein [Gammaproteobacteria bacterium]HIL96793.1 GFA family protein [Pseudomonadales bacterium]